jgi:hypothetical protein
VDRNQGIQRNSESSHPALPFGACVGKVLWEKGKDSRNSKRITFSDGVGTYRISKTYTLAPFKGLAKKFLALSVN